ncbi:MAG: DEAD/DEAH box helicase [Casimicrobium sp.]
MSFSSLNLSPALLSAIAERGYFAPTAVQLAAIPAILQGRDVVASAQTGSGKTAAFALPLLQQISAKPAVARGAIRPTSALILVPTRELAAQVGETVASLSTHLSRRVKVAVVFGGVSINPQMMNLRGGADIVVATPGRLLDLIDHNALSISALSTLVLDEADRLLDLGFGEELQRILKLLPVARQTLFFSATFPPAIETLASMMLQAPLRVETTSETSKPDIVQRAIHVDATERTQLLRHLLQDPSWSRVLVFVATKHGAEIVAEKLRKYDVKAEPFHGELSQGKRQQVLHDFKTKALRVMVATDVAARGIDITQLPVVVNFDLPRSAVDYTHRIGRTGRAGEPGLAVSFVSATTESHFRLIEKRQGFRVPREQIEGFESEETSAVIDNNGGVKGIRPSKKDKLRAATLLQKIDQG